MKKKKIYIIGAGPVGMCIALTLARAGIPSTIVEKGEALCCSGSRAIVLDHGSLIHFRDIGCVDQILKKGLVAEGRKTYFRGKLLYSTSFCAPDSGELPLFINLPQNVTEQILLDEVRKSSLIDVKWKTTLIEIKQKDSGVEIKLEKDGLQSKIVCDYLVAADGARSSVRQLCGLDFPGTNNPYNFLIVDVRSQVHHRPEHHFHFDPPSNPGHTLLMVPQPDGVWRIDWQIPLGVEPCQKESSLCDRIKKVVGNIKFEVVWSSCYKFQQRLMPKMSNGRVFFVGDAAHLVNPFGGRGMNSGIQDARSLSGKMIRVFRDGAPFSVLDSYSSERVLANTIHQEVTGKTMEFIAPVSKASTLKRNMILMGSKTFKSLRRKVDSGKMSMVSPDTHHIQCPL